MVPNSVPLTDAELALVKRIAEREGVDMDEAATRLVGAALARRVKKRTGKVPARIYGLKKR